MYLSLWGGMLKSGRLGMLGTGSGRLSLLLDFTVNQDLPEKNQWD